MAVLLIASAYIGPKQGDMERSSKLFSVSCVLVGILIFIIANSNIPAFIDMLQKELGWFRILDPDYWLYFTQPTSAF